MPLDDEEFEDDPNDRMEHQKTGSIKFSTYIAFFKAAHNGIFVLFMFSAFVAAQFAWSGSDYFLSEW